MSQRPEGVFAYIVRHDACDKKIGPAWMAPRLGAKKSMGVRRRLMQPVRLLRDRMHD